MPCESLDGLSENWDPFKGPRRLPRVDLSGSGRDRVSAFTFTLNMVAKVANASAR